MCLRLDPKLLSELASNSAEAINVVYYGESPYNVNYNKLCQILNEWLPVETPWQDD